MLNSYHIILTLLHDGHVGGQLCTQGLADCMNSQKNYFKEFDSLFTFQGSTERSKSSRKSLNILVADEMHALIPSLPPDYLSKQMCADVKQI